MQVFSFLSCPFSFSPSFYLSLIELKKKKKKKRKKRGNDRENKGIDGFSLVVGHKKLQRRRNRRL